VKEIALATLIEFLNALLQPELFDEKAYNGLQIEAQVPIKKIATAVSVSKEVVQKACEEKVQALVVHHGIFCKDDEHPLIGRRYDIVSSLIQHNIALLCYHLPLDAHDEIGNNWKAAIDLGLTECKPFFEYGGRTIGVIGQLAMPFDSFKQKVEAYYGRSAQFVKVQEEISKVAILSGGADKFIRQAAEAGADCFITGCVDEPVWDDAHDYGVSFLGLGHYGTETVGVEALAKVWAAFWNTCGFLADR
jgi:dinuclear metal center YbgI/SA1388 family protein